MQSHLFRKSTLSAIGEMRGWFPGENSHKEWLDAMEENKERQ